MGERLFGKVLYVRKNYGFISTILGETKVKLFFLISLNMIDENGDFALGENISFLTRNMTVRGTNVLVAYDLKSLDEKPVKIKVIKLSGEIDTNSYKVLNLLNDDFKINDELNKGLMEHDKKVSMFFMKWILFLENQCRFLVDKVILNVKLKTTDFIEMLLKDKTTQKIIKNALKNLKDDTLFRPESDSIMYCSMQNDPHNVEIIDVPIKMLLEQLTLNELVKVLNIVLREFSKFLDDDLKVVLYYATTMLSDVSFIRNKVAHGNIVIPLILDDTFSPSFFYEMSSCFPQWNSNDKMNDVERYPAFEFIRYNSRGLAKQGINLAGVDSGPLIIGLYFTKSLLINQAKKSYFSFAFLLMIFFAYVDDTLYETFIQEMKQLGLFAFEGSEHNIYSKYPNKSSIKIRLSRILLPIFYLGLDTFKVFSKTSLRVSKNTIVE